MRARSRNHRTQHTVTPTDTESSAPGITVIVALHDALYGCAWPHSDACSYITLLQRDIAT